MARFSGAFAGKRVRLQSMHKWSTICICLQRRGARPKRDLARRGKDGTVKKEKINEKPARRTNRRAYSNKSVILWLVCCFPAGMYFLWSPRCEWNRIVKMLISFVVIGALVAVMLPATLPPERYTGGVQLLTAEDLLVGPQPTEGFERIDLYSYNVTTESVIAEPEPTPEPVYVYCNDGGKYYHSAECSYVKATSVHCPLLQALDAGYQQCKECNAPEAY